MHFTTKKLLFLFLRAVISLKTEWMAVDMGTNVELLALKAYC